MQTGKKSTQRHIRNEVTYWVHTDLGIGGTEMTHKQKPVPSWTIYSSGGRETKSKK